MTWNVLRILDDAAATGRREDASPFVGPIPQPRDGFKGGAAEKQTARLRKTRYRASSPSLLSRYNGPAQRRVALGQAKTDEGYCWLALDSRTRGFDACVVRLIARRKCRHMKGNCWEFVGNPRANLHSASAFA